MGLYVGLALLGSGVVLFLVTALRQGPGRAQVAANLTSGLLPGAEAGAESITKQSPTPLGAWARRVMPAGWVRRVERLLARAGRPPNWPLERVLFTKVALGVAASLLGLLYVLGGPGPGRLLLVLVVAGVSFFVPELLLHSRAQERQEQIGRELADTLDQMTIAVEAGLGFDGAVARVARSGTGPLAEELLRTLQDIQVGVSRRDAFRTLAERNTVPDLQRFVSALLQADAYGISVGAVLRTQAREMRIKRRQQSEAKAMEIPVKVIFPLVICILPVLFIVLLGPAALDIVRGFGGG
jgi:tight adherence protein C